MISLVTLVVVVGLADSVNPSTIGPALYLATRARGAHHVLAFAAGAGCAYLLGGAILTFGPGRLLATVVPRPGAHATHVVELGAGALLIAVSAVLWSMRGRVTGRIAREQERLGRSAAIAGVAIMAVELPTAFPYFAVVAAIVSSRRNAVEQLVLLVLFNVAFVAPLLAIAAVRGVAGKPGRARLERARAELDRHAGALIACVVLLVGVVLTAVGGVSLATA